MTSLTEFFNKHEDDALKGISHKNSIIKRNIIAHMAVNGECTLSELTKQLHISVPTITKLVQELVEENIVTDNGKVETPGGRRPNIYGLANSAIYFVGVNVGRDFMGYVVTDLQNNIILEQMDPTFELLDRPQCLDRICTNIEEFVSSCGVDRGKILGLGVCMTGRVNPTTGRSYKYFTSSEESMREIIEERVGIRTLFENDTRARCYAEYSCGKAKDENDMLYLHLGRGIAIGIVMEGKLYYGKSGFAGEFGHIPFFDNEKICACGKIQCLCKSRFQMFQVAFTRIGCHCNDSLLAGSQHLVRFGITAFRLSRGFTVLFITYRFKPYRPNTLYPINRKSVQ